ncbi:MULTISPECIES: hypothetical protein [Vibrio]|uniref:Lipoprotein n=2 Tax=Vibrio TaxID=662 RepID=A0AAU9QUI0_9VIBR|nr:MULTISPECIES: hypothetical protein [Vibrio]MCZ2798876.1 hypothetical protein [Vibrio alginolyticus]POB47002.1 hypothetical protein CRN52_13065 [Vibrio vulnificus]CAH1589859.1 conserved hypothetical protein [Vibrio jasicida]CAH1599430.1 conserved hypothetical protein [Vibrio jasicida]
MNKAILVLAVTSLITGCNQRLRTVTLPDDMMMTPKVSDPYMPRDGEYSFYSSNSAIVIEAEITDDGFVQVRRIQDIQPENCIIKAAGSISELTNRFIVEPKTLKCDSHETELSGTAIGSDERVGLRFDPVTGKIRKNDMRFIFLINKPINLSGFEIEYYSEHPIRFVESL